MAKSHHGPGIRQSHTQDFKLAKTTEGLDFGIVTRRTSSQESHTKDFAPNEPGAQRAHLAESHEGLELVDRPSHTKD